MAHIPNSSLLALDIGAKRVGVALANQEAGFARPLSTLEHNETLMARIQGLCQEYNVAAVICGLPRGMDGQETAQTTYAREFAAKLPALLQLPVYLIDEAVTSAQAKEELTARGKPYQKGDIDALAATYILEDYIQDSLSAIQVEVRK
jgi:putative Holliday junction resolvase